MEAARTLGFEYVSRSAGETTLSILGQQVRRSALLPFHVCAHAVFVTSVDVRLYTIDVLQCTWAAVLPASRSPLQVAYETLYVNEFTSERARMSVIVRCPDGAIKLLCKGSDVKMLQRLAPDTSQHLLQETHNNLHFFATKGLRTLVVGARTIDPMWFEAWADRFEAAQADLAHGEKLMDKVRRLVSHKVFLFLNFHFKMSFVH